MNEKLTLFKVKDVGDHPMQIKRTGEKLGIVKMLSEVSGFKGMLVWQETLPPGRRSSSPHSHSTKEEMIIVKKGTLGVRYGEKTLSVPEGSAISFLPDDTPHVTYNDTDSEVVYLGIATNPSDDEVTYSP